jgi:hypothetical protein
MVFSGKLYLFILWHFSGQPETEYFVMLDKILEHQNNNINSLADK